MNIYTSSPQERADTEAEWSACERAVLDAMLAAIIAPSAVNLRALLGWVWEAHKARERWHRVHTDAKVG